VPDLPKPRPYREIFVYSPFVEGVHLRFGPVARGGLRWSDRREDFRTEVLGLVKAQMVKNTVIVPVGSKGGFFVKRPPVGGDRDAVLAEGIACYKRFINGLLDITDNLVDGKVVHPVDVVRHDGDDPYLVVAADKGTATFSDIANGISAEHGFWLGDAFASGGSVGYDHKGMGITAKGAWESVKRHFRALGRDSQTQDFTCVGIGDMSGDVFGNGMLLSQHIRLLAAFDHRHIFLDPDPGYGALLRRAPAHVRAAALELGGLRQVADLRRRRRVSALGEVDPGLGAGARGAVDRQRRRPDVAAELMNAILKAPVDLLWNGGIGTYVKHSSENNAEVGDRANNALRVDGNQLRCRMVGEGGNLGMTQKGRIEAAQQAGVLLNTDFIDNSAGVDTSDHEVNIKILLGAPTSAASCDGAAQRAAGEHDRRSRRAGAERQLPAEPGDLADGKHERLAPGFLRPLHPHAGRAGPARPRDRVPAQRRRTGRAQVARRRPDPAGTVGAAVLRQDRHLQRTARIRRAGRPYLSKELVRYFPAALQERYAADMEQHRLRREIIATAVTNSTVNRMGATFVQRMQEDTGESPAQIAKAYTISREVLEARASGPASTTLDLVVPEARSCRRCPRCGTCSATSPAGCSTGRASSW
jgi:glutamate dehydrogenase